MGDGSAPRTSFPFSYAYAQGGTYNVVMNATLPNNVTRRFTAVVYVAGAAADTFAFVSDNVQAPALPALGFTYLFTFPTYTAYDGSTLAPQGGATSTQSTPSNVYRAPGVSTDSFFCQ
jgi:hypothetical protein